MARHACPLESDGAGIFLSEVYFEEVLTLDNKGEKGLKKLFSLRYFQDPGYK